MRGSPAINEKVETGSPGSPAEGSHSSLFFLAHLLLPSLPPSLPPCPRGQNAATRKPRAFVPLVPFVMRVSDRPVYARAWAAISMRLVASAARSSAATMRS